MSDKPTYEEIEKKVHERECQKEQARHEDTPTRKEARNVLYVSEEKYKTLFDNMAQGAFYQRADGVVVDCNHAAVEMLGVSRDQFLGKTSKISDLHVIAEDGSTLPDEQHPSMVALTSGKPVRNFLAGVFNSIKKDYVWLNINAIPQFKKGEDKPYQAFVTLHDVTARIRAVEALSQSEQINKESLKLLQLVVDTIPLRLFWKDLDLVFLGCNSLFAKDAGFTDPNDLVGADDFRLTWKEQAELYRKDDLDVIKSGQPKLNYEELQTTSEGKHLTLLTSKVPIRNTKNEIIGILGMYEDITLRKREERELLRMQKLDSLGRLAGGIAHNFNNILTTILGNISLAKVECFAHGKIYERLVHAEAACLNAKDLSQQFLIFSKGGSPVKTPIATADLVTTHCQLALSGTTSTCKDTFTEDLWNIEADAGQIGQVLTNILINADQAMPNGGLIRVDCENVVVKNDDALPLKDGNYVKLSIHDQGSGIEEENLGKIFDPYFTTKATGTGLGLASAYSIIKEHEGYLSVESTLESGSVFTIFIPAITTSIKKTEPSESSIASGYGYILVMDDDKIILDVVGLMLEHLGYESEFAEDGDKALALYEKAMKSEKPFDLTLMDLIIPNGMGGEEAIQKLLAIDPNAKVIVSSGYSSDPIMANYEKYGFSGILKKPYCLAEFSQIMKQLLGDENY
jgi:two-component system cell cycle sensor histidine kinase/response regulator CckA